VARREN